MSTPIDWSDPKAAAEELGRRLDWVQEEVARVITPEHVEAQLQRIFASHEGS